MIHPCRRDIAPSAVESFSSIDRAGRIASIAGTPQTCPRAADNPRGSSSDLWNACAGGHGMAQHPHRPSSSGSALAVRIASGVLALVALIVIGATLASSPASQRSDDDRRVAARPAMAAAPSSGDSTLFSDAYVASLMDIPAFASRAQSQTAAERRELAMNLASLGVPRLDDGALAQRATHLSAVLDRLDDSLCFAVAVGMPLSADQWGRVLKAMSATDSLGACTGSWESAYRAAIVAELERQPGRPRDPKTSLAAVAA